MAFLLLYLIIVRLGRLGGAKACRVHGEQAFDDAVGIWVGGTFFWLGFWDDGGATPRVPIGVSVGLFNLVTSYFDGLKRLFSKKATWTSGGSRS